MRRLPVQKVQELNLRDILVIVFKHKRKISVMFFLTVVVAPILYFTVLRRAPVYEASSLLMIRYGKEYTTPNMGGEPAIRAGLSEIVNSEVSILSSRELKERLVRIVGVEKIYPDLPKVSPKPADPVDLAIPSLELDLSIQSSKGSNLIRVSFRSKNPETAAMVVNQLVDSFMERRLEILRDPRSIAFLERKVAEYRERLNESEDRMRAFKQKNHVFSFDEQRQLLLQQRQALDGNGAAAAGQVKELRQKIQTIETLLKTVAQTVPASPRENGANALEVELVNLERREQDLLSKYKPGNVLVTSVRNEIRIVREYIESQKRNGNGAQGGMANTVYHELQKEIITAKGELSSVEVRSTELAKQLKATDMDIQALDLQEKSFRELKRDLTDNEQNHQAYLKKLEEARISDDMEQQDMTSIGVVEKAFTPLLPTQMSKGLVQVVLFSAFLGLAAGLGLAFLLERVGQGLVSPQMAEKQLALPVLVSISFKKR